MPEGSTFFKHGGFKHFLHQNINLFGFPLAPFLPSPSWLPSLFSLPPQSEALSRMGCAEQGKSN